MERNNPTTLRNRDATVQMFIDGTVGEVYQDGRLLTIEDGEGVSLIAYTWNKIATYYPETDTVTVYTGHAQNVSPTVTRYVNLVLEIAGKRQGRQVNPVNESPNVDRVPADSARFIQNYINFQNENRSPVEEWARDEIDSALIERVHNSFPEAVA